MNIEQAKQLSIVDYLAWKGFQPVKVHGKEVFYNSPLRTEASPSFSVDEQKGVWSDKGIAGERGQKFLGGAIHKLAALLNGNSMSAGLADLAKFSGNASPTTNPLTTAPKNSGSGSISIKNSKIIEHPALVQYLDRRAVKIKIARIVSREVWYRNGEKEYFAIGLKNYAGGWELRSSCFKGGTEPKDLFWLENGNECCRVTEGMFDMLSLMSFGVEKKKSDWLCLNSVSFAARAIPMLQRYKEVHLYLDNDQGGNKGTELLLQSLPQAIDKRCYFSEFKDVNDWIVAMRK